MSETAAQKTWRQVNRDKINRQKRSRRRARPDKSHYKPEQMRQRRAIGRFLVRACKAEGCVDCGERDPIVLDFDHVFGPKTGAVGWMGSGRPTRLLNEISKCEVRCANCHRRATAKRRLVA